MYIKIYFRLRLQVPKQFRLHRLRLRNTVIYRSWSRSRESEPVKKNPEPELAKNGPAPLHNTGYSVPVAVLFEPGAETGISVESEFKNFSPGFC